MGTHHQPLALALRLPTLRTPSPVRARKPGLGMLIRSCGTGLCVRRELTFKKGIKASSTFPFHGHQASACLRMLVELCGCARALSVSVHLVAPKILSWKYLELITCSANIPQHLA